MSQTILCPICKKEILPQGLKNHIINAAKNEVWKNLDKKPHKEYYEANSIIIEESKFITKK